MTTRREKIQVVPACLIVQIRNVVTMVAADRVATVNCFTTPAFLAALMAYAVAPPPAMSTNVAMMAAGDHAAIVKPTKPAITAPVSAYQAAPAKNAGVMAVADHARPVAPLTKLVKAALVPVRLTAQAKNAGVMAAAAHVVTAALIRLIGPAPVLATARLSLIISPPIHALDKNALYSPS